MILISLRMRAVRFSELAIRQQMSLNTFFGHEMLVLLGLLVRLRYNDNLVCFRLLSGRGALPGCCYLGGGGRRPAVQPEGKSKANITRKKPKNIQAIDLIFNNLFFFYSEVFIFTVDGNMLRVLAHVSGREVSDH